MLVLLDIGNTAVTYGTYKKGRLLHFDWDSYDDIPNLIQKCFKSGGSKEHAVVLSSVVPKYTEIVAKTVSKLPNIPLWIAGQNLPVPISNHYKDPKKLGIDRLINMYGALKMYKAPALVIDYGTATKFDYLSSKGAFEGGMIIPGLEISFQALTERAALLPKKLRLPKKAANFLGKDTYECMASGILEGYGAMTDGLIARFRERFGKKLKVIATGGYSLQMKPFVRSFDVVDPKHLIKSLLLLYKAKP